MSQTFDVFDVAAAAAELGRGVGTGRNVETPPAPRGRYTAWWIGFWAARVEPGASVSVWSRPYEASPETLARLWAPAWVRESFLIRDLRHGNRSLFINSEAVPASWLLTGRAFAMPRVQVSQDVGLCVENKAPAPRDFTAVLYFMSTDKRVSP